MNRSLAAMFLMVVCLGCPKRPPKLDFGEAGEVTDPEALLKLVQAAEARVVTLEGESKLRIESPETKGTVTLFLAVSRPSLLHFEPLDFFGRPQGLLVTNGERFMLFDQQAGKNFVGPASPMNVSRFLPVVLPAEELVAILLGQVPRIPADEKSLKVDEEAGGYVLVLKQGSVTQTLVIDTKSHRVLKSQVRGAPAYDLELADLEMKGPAVMPHEIKLISSAAKTSLTIRYTDVKLNAAPDLTMFDLEPLPDFPVVEVDERGNPVPTMSEPAPPPEG